MKKPLESQEDISLQRLQKLQNLRNNSLILDNRSLRGLNRSKRYIGIDISKDTFVVAFPILTNVNSNNNYDNYEQFELKTYPNNLAGVKSFMERLDKKCDHCVLEATGNYSLELSYGLHQMGYLVSVINPKRIKQFMKLMANITKTDQQDAKLISCFGLRMKPSVFHPKSKSLLQLKQKRQLLTQLQERRKGFNNMLHALNHHIYPDASTRQHLEETVDFLGEKIKHIKQEILNISKADFEEQYQLLTSIPAVGERVATALIEITGGFTAFDNPKQLAKFLGIAPTHFQSGTSLNIKGQINRTGNKQLRNLLYMSSLTAIKHNEPCKEMYERLKTNNKPSKLALVAVMNKLVRQAFGVIKNKTLFDPDFAKRK